MPIKLMARYTPQDCQTNPNDLFVFGDNFQRKGKAGQAVIRGEPNAIGICTKRAPSMKEHAFLTDEDFHDWEVLNVDAFRLISDRLEAKAVVVFPLDGLGTGLAELPMRAPLIYAELYDWQARLVKKYGRRR